MSTPVRESSSIQSDAARLRSHVLTIHSPLGHQVAHRNRNQVVIIAPSGQGGHHIQKCREETCRRRL